MGARPSWSLQYGVKKQRDLCCQEKLELKKRLQLRRLYGFTGSPRLAPEEVTQKLMAVPPCTSDTTTQCLNLERLHFRVAAEHQQCDVLKEWYRRAESKSHQFREELERTELRLDQYKRITIRLQWEADAERRKFDEQEKTLQQGAALQERMVLCEATTQNALQRLIEEQMFREVDAIKNQMIRDGLQRRTREAEEEVKRHRAEVLCLKKRTEELLKKVEELTQLNRRLDAALESARDREAKLKRLSHAQEITIATLKERIAALETKLLESEEQMNKDAIEHVKKDAQLIELSETINSLREALRVARDKESLLFQKVETTVRELQDTQHQLDSTSRALKELERERQINKEGFNTSLKRLDAEKEALQNRLEARAKDLSTAESKTVALAAELRQQKRDAEERQRDMELRNQHLRDQVAQLEKEISSARDESLKLREAVGGLEKDIAQRERDAARRAAEEKLRAPVRRQLDSTRQVSVAVTPRTQRLSASANRLIVGRSPEPASLAVQRIVPIARAPRKAPGLTRWSPQALCIPSEKVPLPPRPPLRRQPLTAVTIEPDVVMSSPELVSSSRPSPVRRKWEPPTGPFISLKPAITSLQRRLLSGADASAEELLKRKPTADELAAVAVTGAQHGRRGPGSGSPLLAASESALSETKME